MKLTMHENEDLKPRRGIYLLPNLLTTGALFAGFYAIVAAMQGRFENAAIAVFVALIMDGLDGRVARLTGTQSAFGAQYDSLSDMVSFGMTPALVVYSWDLHHLGKLGWLAAFIYTSATALRLARFNIQAAVADKRYFIGLPSPAAASVIVGMVWVGAEYQIAGRRLSELMAFMTAGMGALMVSNFRYYSFKDIDLKEHVPFMSVLAVLLIYILIAWDPPTILLSGFFLYAISGPVLWLKRRAQKKNITSVTSKQ